MKLGSPPGKIAKFYKHPIDVLTNIRGTSRNELGIRKTTAPMSILRENNVLAASVLPRDVCQGGCWPSTGLSPKNMSRQQNSGIWGAFGKISNTRNYLRITWSQNIPSWFYYCISCWSSKKGCVWNWWSRALKICFLYKFVFGCVTTGCLSWQIHESGLRETKIRLRNAKTREQYYGMTYQSRCPYKSNLVGYMPKSVSDNA